MIPLTSLVLLAAIGLAMGFDSPAPSAYQDDFLIVQEKLEEAPSQDQMANSFGSEHSARYLENNLGEPLRKEPLMTAQEFEKYLAARVDTDSRLVTDRNRIHKQLTIPFAKFMYKTMMSYSPYYANNKYKMMRIENFIQEVFAWSFYDAIQFVITDHANNRLHDTLMNEFLKGNY